MACQVENDTKHIQKLCNKYLLSLLFTKIHLNFFLIANLARLFVWPKHEGTKELGEKYQKVQVFLVHIPQWSKCIVGPRLHFIWSSRPNSKFLIVFLI